MPTFKNCINCGSSYRYVGLSHGCCSVNCSNEMERKKKHDAQMLQAAQSQAKSQPIQQSSSSGSGIGDAVGTAAVGTAATVAVAAGGLAFGAGKALVENAFNAKKKLDEQIEAIQNIEIPTDPIEMRRMFFSLSNKITFGSGDLNEGRRNPVLRAKLESIIRYWKIEGIDDPQYQQILTSLEEEFKTIDRREKQAYIKILKQIVVLLPLGIFIFGVLMWLSKLRI